MSYECECGHTAGRHTCSDQNETDARCRDCSCPRYKLPAAEKRKATPKTIAKKTRIVTPARVWEAPGPAPAADYERDGVRLYRADALDVLPHLYERGHIIFDAPYSRRLHESAEVAGQLPDGSIRQGGFDFSHLTPDLRRALARHSARLAARWVLVFSESESPWLWRMSLQAAGLKYHSTGYWIKRGGRPNFKGDGPGVGAEPITVCQRDQRIEPITICHGRPTDEERASGAGGKSRWNCGGNLGVWEHPIVHDTEFEPRLHATPKPPKLMVELVEDFTDPEDLVYDFTAGAFSTGIGCIRAAGGKRRFIGFERDPDVFARGVDRIEAELDGSDYSARKRGQVGLFA